MTQAPDSADFVISTILDEEFDAVKAVFSLEQSVNKGARQYVCGNVDTNIENPQKYSVVLGKIWDRGNVSAGVAVSQIVQDWNPKFILIVGIAGGVSGAEQEELGDVVVSKEVEYEGMKKEIEGGTLDRRVVEDMPSPVLVATHEKIKNNNWQMRIKEKRPIDDSKQPKIVFGDIISGEKVRGNPNSSELKDILSKNDKLIAVDMESGGFAISLYQNRADHNELGYIAIRGISDFCNKENNNETRMVWIKYAASAAAAFALELVKNTPSQDSQPVRSTYVKELKEKLPAEPETDFDLTFTPNKDALQQKPIEELIGFVTSNRKVVLNGRAGGGKSSAVNKISRILINKGATPIILNLKKWKKTEHSEKLKEKNDNKSKMDFLLLKTSASTINIESLEEPVTKWIIVDGLNEVAAGEDGEKTVREIVDIVENYIHTDFPHSYALITDRASERGFLSSWNSVKLNSIDEEKLCEIINENFGDSKFETLNPPDKEVLQIPFFLNIALNAKSLVHGTEARILELFFTDYLDLNGDQLNNLARCVFNLSKQSLQLNFKLNEFKNCIKNDLFDLLENIGEIKHDGTDISFEHQLKRDYLISRYLALHEDEWNWKSFDIASLEYNSPESILMTLEQLNCPEKSDRFLREIYDWNWPTAINSLSRMEAKETKYHSNEIKTVMLALVAQKMFDPVYRTSKSAKTYLDSFDDTVGKQMANAKELSDVISIVNGSNSTNEWFNKWKQLFTRKREQPLLDDEVALIADNTSLLGWTASNVLKECNLDESQQSKLIFLYNANKGNTPVRNTIRWRIVHTLGRFDSQKNAELLFCAIDNDEYHWAVYGAVRSVVEMAAITKNPDLRKYLFSKLAEKLPKFRAYVMEEIVRAACYRTSPDTWKEEIKPLLDECGKQQIIKKDDWIKRIEFFEGEEWRKN